MINKNPRVKEQIAKLRKKVQDKKTKKQRTKISKAHLHAIASEYLLIGDEEKVLRNRKIKLKAEIETLAKDTPDKYVDDKGSTFVDLPDGVVIKFEKRISACIDQERALAYAKKKGLNAQLTHTERFADMDSFEQLNLQDVISDKDLESLVDINESEALKITKQKGAS